MLSSSKPQSPWPTPWPIPRPCVAHREMEMQRRHFGTEGKGGVGNTDDHCNWLLWSVPPEHHIFGTASL
jgi:hypothetical protein